MAFDSGGAFGGGGAGGGTGIPGLGGGAAPPPPVPIFANFPNLSLTNYTPHPFLGDATVTTTPDYNTLLGQAMGPYQDAYNQQQAALNRALAAMEDQISHQEGYAREAYGINKQSDQAAYDQYIKQLIATLVGRGLGNSGARNYYTRIRSEALQRQLALLRNQLNSYIYGLQSQLTNARLSGESQMAGMSAQLAAQRQSIAQQLPSLYPATVRHPFSMSG